MYLYEHVLRAFFFLRLFYSVTATQLGSQLEASNLGSRSLDLSPQIICFRYSSLSA